MRVRGSLLTFFVLCLAALAGCAQGGQSGPNDNNNHNSDAVPPVANPYMPTAYVKLKHPDWARNAVIYQINTRQFTREGTFRAAEAHLPRLKELGADILWLMPIHKIRSE